MEMFIPNYQAKTHCHNMYDHPRQMFNKQDLKQLGVTLTVSVYGHA
jgi:hypothetical protein